MDDSRPRKRSLKVRRGVGTLPPILWKLWMLNESSEESERLLSLPQREHMKLQLQEVARYEHPTGCPSVDIRSIEDFFELRDKGGILGIKNVGLLFFLDAKNTAFVTSGLILKQDDDHTPIATNILMRNRIRSYYQNNLRP